MENPWGQKLKGQVQTMCIVHGKQARGSETDRKVHVCTEKFEKQSLLEGLVVTKRCEYDIDHELYENKVAGIKILPALFYQLWFYPLHILPARVLTED